MHQCSQKALSCDVPGCRKITRRISMHEHYINAAESHQQLQSGEVERLRQASVRMMYLHFYSSETKCFFYTVFCVFRGQEVVYCFHNRSGKPFYFNLIVSHLIQSIHRRPHFNLFGVKTTYFKPLAAQPFIMLFNLSISASGYKRSTLSGRSLLSLWNFT